MTGKNFPGYSDSRKIRKSRYDRAHPAEIAAFMEILGFDPNRESSFSSLRGSKEALPGVPERSFYEVLRFLQKKFF